MEANLKKTIIVDFYGLPGSGKSTVSHAFSDALKQKGYCVEEPTYMLDHKTSPIKRKALKMFRTAIYLIWQRENSTAIALNIWNAEKKSFSRWLSQYVNISNKLFCLKRLMGKCDYIVFDEGMIQSILSVSFDSETAEDEIKNISQLYEFDELKVFVSVPQEIALERIIKRNEKNAMVERIGDTSAQLKMLEKMRILYQLVNPDIILNGINSIESQVHDLVSFIQDELAQEKVDCPT